MEGVIEELKEENEVLTKKSEEGLALLIQAKNDIEEQLERIEELNAEADHLHDLKTARGRKINQLEKENERLKVENERLQKDLKDSK